MVKFPTQYRNHFRVTTNPGKREKITYSGRYNKKGILEVVPTGKVNVYDEIQSYGESCDINTVVKRFTLGDETALSQVQGFYGDVTGMPKTYAEVLNTVIEGRENFEKLPVAVKEKFGNDYNRFIAEINTKEWFEKLYGTVDSVRPAVDGSGVLPQKDIKESDKNE